MKLKTKPNGIYFIEFEGPDENGVVGRRRISFDTRDIRQAREQLRLWNTGMHPKQLSARIAEPDLPVKATEAVTGWTVRKALDRCELTVWKNAKAQASLLSNVKIVNSLVGDELVEDMCYDRIERLIQQMEEMGYAPGTIKRKLDVLSKAVSMSSVWRNPSTGKPYIVGKPKWPQLKFNNQKERELTESEEKAVFAAIDERIRKDPQKPWWRFRCLIRTLLDTGLRLSEALAMDDDHLTKGPVIDPRTGETMEVVFHNVRPEEAKNGRGRVVPLSEAVLDVGPLLSMQSGGGKWFPFKPAGAWQMWDYIRQDLGKQGVDIADVVLHTLRHTCASRLRRQGLSLDYISIWLGHSDISITHERYVHKSGADIAAAAISAGFASNSSKVTLTVPEGSDEKTGNFPVSLTMRANNGMAHC